MRNMKNLRNGWAGTMTWLWLQSEVSVQVTKMKCGTSNRVASGGAIHITMSSTRHQDRRKTIIEREAVSLCYINSRSLKPI